jgi:hypothetical protein
MLSFITGTLPPGPEPTPGVPASPTCCDYHHLPKIEPQLLKKLLESTPIRSLYRLLKRPPISRRRFRPRRYEHPDGWIASRRRAAIVNALQETARTSRAGSFGSNGPPPPASLPDWASPNTDIRPCGLSMRCAVLDMVLALAAFSVRNCRLDKKTKLGIGYRAKRLKG